ncbi:hypothetical protein EFK07_30390 [Pseudomonas putida]|uniref:Uncharacterized protein n=1 Tax=Pseudomonas putida TaxID=303 RepID=A0A3M8S8Z3_PSEPU|nr:hypothetical protein EFK07_30390 [Pseudomonas putida]
MGAGSSRRRTAANTGEAGAIHRVAVFAGKPAPTGAVRPLQFRISAPAARRLRTGLPAPVCYGTEWPWPSLHGSGAGRTFQ